MCFSKTYNSRMLYHRVAESDIECYKVMIRGLSKDTDEYCSPYMKFCYRRGELYETGIEPHTVRLFDCKMSLDSDVIHSYVNRDAANALYFHTSLKCSNGEPGEACIVRCVIPKGAVYWENGFEYASDRIKLVEVVK